MKSDRVARILGRTTLFGELDEATLLDLAKQISVRSYDKNESIFHFGDEGDSLYVVAEGLLKIFVPSEEGDEMVLATLREGDSFGELAVIDREPRSASAKTIEATQLIVFRRAVFLEMLRQHPSLMAALHRSLGTLLRRALEQAADLVFLDLPGRVAKLLVSLAAEKGESRDDGTLLDLGLTQTTLAAMVGGSRPSVNQILRSFEAKGLVSLEGRRIVIKDSDALRARSS